ncbi:BatA domain-containing protein [Mesoflavibacter zeaxanthinifaciens]|uniref:BatA domain-containing protein n=1 Tax=Mesoflavibacter zeaxanthinifaciens TaxID=393060 RepID=UPI003A93692D
MQFKNPELLYALFLLLIPIIVHLFQLRKFKKEAFTNVAFLKQVQLQTRKSAVIKKWLILVIRMALLAAIIIAFAQPFTSKNTTVNTTRETVIFLDNSFSMQSKGAKGELLKRAIQDLISTVPENEKLSLITNDDAFRNTTLKSINNAVLAIDYATTPLDYEAAFLKSKKYFSDAENTIKNLVFISDFQNKGKPLSVPTDSTITTHLVHLKPVNTNNIVVDSLAITKQTPTYLELTVYLKNNGKTVTNLPVSFFNNEALLAKTAVSFKNETTTGFTIPNNTVINGKVAITDTNLQFDNSLFFNINLPQPINVLSINEEANDSFLKRIYTKDEFNYIASTINELNYSSISSQNLIILNELSQIPSALSTAIQSFTNNGGVLIIIPNETIDLKSYNSFLANNNLNTFTAAVSSEKRLTTINYSHPIYSNGVFENEVSNFQYPKVNSYYKQALQSASKVLQLEDGSSFLSEQNNRYVFTAALNTNNSTFQSINLIVPTFYNIARRSLKRPNLYFTIGRENTFDVSTTLQQDRILTLENANDNIIPRQHYFNNKVSITTNETPTRSGIYTIKNKEEILNSVSYNYSRDESLLNYHDLSTLEGVVIANDVSTVFNTIKNDYKVNALWKWFVIFAIILLIIELLILKYFK